MSSGSLGEFVDDLVGGHAAEPSAVATSVSLDNPPPAVMSFPARRSDAARSFPPAVRYVEAGPETSFDLPIGTGVKFTENGHSWSVAVLSVKWFDQPCGVFQGGGSGRETSPILVADLRLEALDGALDRLPQTRFAYIGPLGVPVRATTSTGCDDPALEVNDLDAPTTVTGSIAFTVKAGAGGELTYSPRNEPLASWSIPPRSD